MELGQLMQVKTIFFLFLSALFCNGQALFMGGNPPPSITADSWCDFEFSAPTAGSMTTGALAGSTHGTAVTWTLRGANNFTTSSAGEEHTLSNVNGTPDAGTTGLALAADGSTFMSIQAAFGSGAVNSASAGIWYHVPASFSTDSNEDIFQFSDSSGDLLLLAQLRRVSGVYNFHFIASGLAADIAVPAMSSWYWITMKFIKSGTCSAAVYTSAGVQVSTTQTTTDTTGLQTSNVRIGQEDTSTAITPVSIYWDDLVVNTTTATFPLGP